MHTSELTWILQQFHILFSMMPIIKSLIRFITWNQQLPNFQLILHKHYLAFQSIEL